MSLFDKDEQGEQNISFLGNLFHGATFYVFMVLLVAGVIFGFKFYIKNICVNSRKELQYK